MTEAGKPAGVLSATLAEILARPLHYALLTGLPQVPVLVLAAVLGGSGLTDPAATVVAAWEGGLLGLLWRTLLAYGLFCLASLAFVAGTAAVSVSLVARLEGGDDGALAVWQAVGRRLWPLAGSMVLGCLIVLALLALVCVLFFGPLFLFASAEEGGGGRLVLDLLKLVQVWAEAPGSRLYLAGVLLVVTLYLLRVLVKWVLAPQVAVLEGGTPERVLWRSRVLVHGIYWRTLGLLLALLVAQSVSGNLLALLVGLPLRLVLDGQPAALATAVVGVLANLLVLPLPALGTTYLYLERRALEDRASDEAARAPGQAAISEPRSRGIPQHRSWHAIDQPATQLVLQDLGAAPAAALQAVLLIEELTRRSRSTGRESAGLVNLTTGARVGPIAIGDETSVRGDQLQAQLLAMSEGIRCLHAHTHLRSAAPSGVDGRFLIGIAGIEIVLVRSRDGTVYILSKGSEAASAAHAASVETRWDEERRRLRPRFRARERRGGDSVALEQELSENLWHILAPEFGLAFKPIRPDRVK